MKKTIIFFIILISSTHIYSQKYTELKRLEDSLISLGKIIRDGETDFIKYNANEKFLILLEKALITENSFNYPFDSLITIARLKSEDNKFRIFNWLLKKADGTYEYFGFIQAWNKKLKKHILYPLKDNSENIKTLETQLLEPINWYGVLYYKIIYNKYRGKRTYTLLGWDGNDKQSQKKIIDVISFNSKDKPVFGAAIFKYNKKIMKRIVFEYNSTVSFSLKYEKQYMLYGKKKRKMIVFNRMGPLESEMVNNKEFYFPEINIFDAFLFKNGKWIHIKDVDARNAPIGKTRKKQQKKIRQLQLENSIE